MTQKNFTNLSIKRKLTLLIMLISSVALLLACLAVVVYDQISFRRILVNNLSTLAEIAGDNSTAALAFNDHEAADEVLSALNAEKGIVLACIHDNTDQPFAMYFRDESDHAMPELPSADGHFFIDDHLVIVKTIFIGEERIGRVLLKSDLRALDNRLQGFLGIVAIVLLVALFVAFSLSSMLQRVITKPILHLVLAARAVSERKDYTVRAKSDSKDELGLLVKTFNEMLSQIQERDSALRISREKLEQLSRQNQLILNSAGEGICGMDLKGNTTFINPAAAKILRGQIEEFIGKPLHEILRFSNSKDDTLSREEHPLYAAFRKKDVHHMSEKVFLRKDETSFPVEYISTPIRNENNELEGAVFTFRDITERKQAEEQIKSSLAEKEVLLKEIHHRVKNNLQIISSLLNLQADFVTDQLMLDMLKESQNRVKSMALIHEKLYQSKDLSQIDFGEYIRNLTNYLMRSYTVDTNAIKLYIDVTQIELSVNAAVPCGLLINELISNSFKHAFPKGRKGSIDIELFSANDGQIVLVVKDSGVGLPQNFDIKKAKSLGLQLVNTLSQQLKGKMKLSNNAGTEFRLTFHP